MDKSTNTSNSKNFAVTNKKVIDVSFLLIIILILISTFASAKSKYGYNYNSKKNRAISIGLETGLVQRKMIYNINNYEQKYLEMGYRLSVSKKIYSNIGLELAAYNTFTNTAPNTNYSYSDKNTIISLSTIYSINLFNKVSFEPKIGIGWMQHHDHSVVNNEQLTTSINQSQVLLLGAKMRVNLTEWASIGSGLDMIIGDKNHVFPYAHGGMYFSLFNNKAGNNRKCPSKF